METKSVKITVEIPTTGLDLAMLAEQAQNAAQTAVNGLCALFSAAEPLAALGIDASSVLGGVVAAPAKAKTKRKAGEGGGRGRRTVLTDEQRKDLVNQLRGGMTAAAVAENFGVSTATVNNIKRDAGLVTPRGDKAIKTAKAPATKKKASGKKKAPAKKKAAAPKAKAADKGDGTDPLIG